MKVLVTTSGLGSRLGKLTDFTNKSLVRIGDKPAISTIIEHYPKDTEFIITTGHKGEHVEQFLSIAYPNKKIKFVKVDPYEGKGSSLGYSILQAKEQLQEPFIFNCCDTILTPKDPIPNPSYNWCAVSRKENSSQFRTLQTNQGFVTHINEKGETGYDFVYIGLCGIKDYELFWLNLEAIKKNKNLSDVHVINKMIKEVPFRAHETKLWLDAGSTEELEKARKALPSTVEILDKENEATYIFEDSVVKFFGKESVNLNRVKRASYLKGIVPNVIQHSKNFYKYEKAEGTLVSKASNETEFEDLLRWANEKLWIRARTKNFEEKCRNFYIDKSLRRIRDYLHENEDEKNPINGESIPPASHLINSISDELISSGVPSRIHGDFILDNILKTKNGFTLLDWRQDFAGDLECGDLYYDLAKLNHNLTVNHDIVKRGLYQPDPSNCHILCNSTLMRFKKILHDFISKEGFCLKKVKTLSSVIWINMSPLHEYPFSKFLFNFGKYNLYKELKKHE